MYNRLALPGGLGAGALLIVACIDGTAPVYGTGCTNEPESVMQLEGDTLITQMYITRDYRQTYVSSNTARTMHYRTCQQYRCAEVRADPAVPVTEAEGTAAVAACRSRADEAWATRDLT